MYTDNLMSRETIVIGKLRSVIAVAGEKYTISEHNIPLNPYFLKRLRRILQN